MLNIDPEFKSLIPPLTTDEYSQLEENIKAEGCRDSLVIWNDTILDGHNRYEICERHKIPYKTVEKQMADKDEAKIWIIRNQFGRRNLSTFQRAELALQLKPLIQAKAKENLKTSTGGSNPQPCPKSDKPAIDTKKELSKIANLSHDTIWKSEQIIKHGNEELLQQVRSGEKSIKQGYEEAKGIVKPKQESIPRQSKKQRELEQVEKIYNEMSQDNYNPEVHKEEKISMTELNSILNGYLMKIYPHVKDKYKRLTDDQRKFTLGYLNEIDETNNKLRKFLGGN